MPNYWIMAPIANDARGHFDQVWSYDKSKGVISIGWNVGQFDSPQQLEEMYWLEAPRRIERGEKKPWGAHGLRQLKCFWYKVKARDKILARRGIGSVIGMGEVTGHPFYSREMAQEQAGPFPEDHAYFLHVRWKDLEKVITSPRFSSHALCALEEPRFREITEGNEL